MRNDHLRSVVARELRRRKLSPDKLIAAGVRSGRLARFLRGESINSTELGLIFDAIDLIVEPAAEARASDRRRRSGVA